ncbi:PAS domain S-box protein [Ktedonobacter racemifer]|uniref:histidine kinase n=1 Tax=Ktedonobacter racemifer DSM 44963 TaxID=485913 RepID=D6TK86_KTERA|nr:PAS domain S-box protein [Ktedonobacter racemifer]EFH86186.1 PAS/PAC sensor signal transduction histidine kinase [Ktedonobacter racemifer DSM 44963]
MPNPKPTERLTPALSETLLTLLETLPGALFVVDDAATIVYANASAQTLTGATRGELLGKPLWRGAPHLVSTVLYQAIQRTTQTRAPTEVEYVSPVKETWLHVQLAPTVRGLIVQVHQGRAAALREAPVPQGEYLSIEDLDGLYSRIGVLTPEGIVLEINEVPLAEAQIRREEVLGYPLTETRWWSFYPTSQAQLRAAIARASRGETVRFEAVVHPREGMDCHLDVAISTRMDADHHIAYLVIAGIDITARKRAEAEIHAVIDAIPQLVWTGQPDGSIDYYNRRLCDYSGQSTEEAQGEGWLQCLHPEDRQRVRSAWQRAVQTGGVYEAELRLRQSTTGEYRWFLVRAMPVRDEAGQIVRWFGTCTDIEDQKRAEQQLKESRENLRVLAETVPQLVWATRPDGWSEYFNQRFCDYTHATWEQLYGYGWRQFLHPDDYERTLAVREHAFRTGVPYEVEFRLREGQTGLYHWFLARAMPMRDETGQIVKWFGTCTDIDEQKQAEQQLKESRESLRVLAETVPQFVWVTRPDGLHEYVNQRWRDYTGLTLEQMQSDRWAYLQFIHPEDRQRHRAHWQHALDTGIMYEHEERIKNGQTGEYRWFLARGMPVRDDAGQIVKWFGTCTDIEDQKRAEQQLKESEENWRVLAEMVPHFMWTALPSGQFEYFNQRWFDYIGLTLKQLQNDRWAYLQLIHPDDRDGNRAIWQHALDTGDMFEYEERLRNGQSGEYHWFLLRAMPVRDEAGQIIKWFGTCTDIDDRKRAEEALRQSQERASILMNSNIIGIKVIEGEQIVDANDTFMHMTGYTREDLRERHMNLLHMTAPEYLARTLEAHQELAAQQSLTPYEKEYVCKDGSRLPVLVGGIALEHHPRQAICFVLDNSARKELEQRKDDFISMASHELRNPLTALALHTNLLHRQLARHGTLDQAPALSGMETQINKISRLVEELLDVSKMQAGRLEYREEMIDLDALLREIADTMQQTHPSHRILVGGAVRTSLLADRDRLGQVFINLLSNAIKYSPGAETVEMDLSASREMVTIRVQDHGLGIPREQCDKIFERFYRATGSRQRAIPGLGMGLYIVAEIVKHHGGSITVDSEVGKGSTFTVIFPKKRAA